MLPTLTDLSPLAPLWLDLPAAHLTHVATSRNRLVTLRSQFVLGRRIGLQSAKGRLCPTLGVAVCSLFVFSGLLPHSAYVGGVRGGCCPQTTLLVSVCGRLGCFGCSGMHFFFSGWVAGWLSSLGMVMRAGPRCPRVQVSGSWGLGLPPVALRGHCGPSGWRLCRFPWPFSPPSGIRPLQRMAMFGRSLPGMWAVLDGAGLLPPVS